MQMTLFFLLFTQIPTSPEWTQHNSVREVEDSSLGDVLTDIEEHLPVSYQSKYIDKVTWAHEATHTINSNIRVHKPDYDAFYVLNNQAFVTKQLSSVTIEDVRRQIPSIFQDAQYQLYLAGIPARVSNNRPLYLLDEWVAYTNATECVLELIENDLWKDTDKGTAEAMIMTKFNLYALILLSSTSDPDPQLVSFVQWNLQRSLSLWERTEMEPKAHMDETMIFWRNFMILPENKALREKIKKTIPDFWKTSISLGDSPTPPPRERKVLYITGLNCPGCLAFNQTEIPKLQSLGYTFGTSEKNHFEKIDDSDANLDRYEEISAKYEIKTIPSMILLEGDKPSIVIQSNRKRITSKDALRLYNHGYHGYPILGK